MTTARHIMNLVAPLLQRHEDLALVGNMVIVKPLHHLLRGIMIDRTGEAARCRPRWIVTELFAKHDHVPLGIGELLHRQSGLWRLADPDVSEALVEVAERNALPMLRSIATIREYVALAIPDDPRARRYYAAAHVLYLFALGDLDSAREILANEEQASDFWTPRLRRLGLGERLTERGDRLDANDRCKLAALLHEWEAYTVDKLKLGDIWEKTPFPLECPPASG